MKDNLQYWLLSDDARAVHWRGTAPFADLASALKEYKDKTMTHEEYMRELVRRAHPDPERRTATPAELEADRIEQYATARSDEADRLFRRLDDPLLSPDERQATIARLHEIRDELQRVDVARRKLARQQAS